MNNNSKSDNELCRNACGFYGNRIWDGFCSKCYREVYQQSKKIQEDFDEKSRNNNKWHSNLTMKNPIRQIVNRAGSFRSSSTNDKELENEGMNKCFESISSDEVRLDLKNQICSFVQQFSRKSSNNSTELKILIDDYSNFFQTIKLRIETDEIYRNESEDLPEKVRDLIEFLIFSKNYSSIFDRLAIEHEEQDLSIQNRISSLHWIKPSMLDAVVHQETDEVRESIYKSINALIEIDSKRTPQEKILSIMESKHFIEQSLRNCTDASMTINADSFLPALIYVVLQAKPPRLHSNIQFLSHFSQPNGEQLYYLANLDSAVRFIEQIQAEHLGLSNNDFAHYMRGEPISECESLPLFQYPMEINSQIEQIQQASLVSGQLDHQYERFNENLRDFHRRLNQSFSDVRQFINNSYARWSPFTFDKTRTELTEDKAENSPATESNSSDCP